MAGTGLTQENQHHSFMAAPYVTKIAPFNPRHCPPESSRHLLKTLPAAPGFLRSSSEMFVNSVRGLVERTGLAGLTLLSSVDTKPDPLTFDHSFTRLTSPEP